MLVRYDRDADGLETFNESKSAVGTDEAFEASDRQGATGLDRIRLVPVLLIGGLLLLVAAALGHVLLVSVGMHRRDLAVLERVRHDESTDLGVGRRPRDVRRRAWPASSACQSA